MQGHVNRGTKATPTAGIAANTPRQPDSLSLFIGFAPADRGLRGWGIHQPGREGIRFAIEDMTELRLLVIRTPQDG